MPSSANALIISFHILGQHTSHNPQINPGLDKYDLNDKKYKRIERKKPTYARVDVDLGRRLAGQPDELPRVELPDDHLPGPLDGPEGLGGALVVAVLDGLDLPEDLVRDAADLKGGGEKGD